MRETPDDIVEGPEMEWVQMLLGLNANDVISLLVDRWAHVQNDGFRDLARMILMGRPHSVVVATGITWLKTRISKYIATEKGKQTIDLFVRRPFYEEEASFCLERFVLTAQTRCDMISLIQSFGGLRDMEPGHSGSFLEPPKVSTVGEWFWRVDMKEACHFPILFDAANGDLLGVFPDGRTGWYCIEDYPIQCPVRPFASSIPDTVRRWANCNDWIDGCVYDDDAWQAEA